MFPYGNTNIFSFHIFDANVCVYPWFHSAGEIRAAWRIHLYICPRGLGAGYGARLPVPADPHPDGGPRGRTQEIRPFNKYIFFFFYGHNIFDHKKVINSFCYVGFFLVFKRLRLSIFDLLFFSKPFSMLCWHFYYRWTL